MVPSSPPPISVTPDLSKPETDKEILARFNQLTVYKAVRGNVNTLVLQEGATSTIIAAGSVNPYSGNHAGFDKAFFSPHGNYIVIKVFANGEYEVWVYDIAHHHVVLSTGGADGGHFNAAESLYYICDANRVAGGTVRVYSVPDFAVKTDLLDMFPQFDLIHFMSWNCTEDAARNLIMFNFSDPAATSSYNQATSTGAYKLFEVNATTGVLQDVK